MRRAVLVLLLPILAMPLALASGPARVDAALNGLTRFNIDGNTAGPDDWDAPYPGLLGTPFSFPDQCVTRGRNIDPDQLDGKLDALDLSNPDPTPGNVVPKGDLCKVWRAVEYVDSGTTPRPVFYGAWSRPANVNGEVTVFFPFVGPAAGKADDVLVAFEYDSAKGGSTRGAIWRWSGTTWRPTTVTTGFEAAVDNSSRPTFGEFALDLTAVGLFVPGSCQSAEATFAFTRTGQENSNAELQDYAGMDPLPLSNCSRLEITKHTVPAVPATTDFGFTVGSIAGGAVDEVTGAATITDTLTVPGDPTFTSTNVVARDDLTLTESSVPTGWDLTEMTCVATDTDNTSTTFELVLAGAPGPAATFTTFPGGVTRCTITNEQRGSITIVKVADPADGTDFPFTTTGPGLSPFSLDVDGDPALSSRITFDDLRPGVEYSVTEAVPAGWVLHDITCAGGDATTESLSTATAVISLKVGEDVVCVFTNDTPPPQGVGTLIVLKVAQPADGTDFPFTGSTGIGSFTLDNDPIDAPDATNPAFASFDLPEGTHTVAETVPAGWDLAGIVCTGNHTVLDASVDVDVTAGFVDLCVFTNLRPASLTVVKRTAPAGGTGFPFTVEPSASAFTLADGTSHQINGLTPDLYTITEATPPGWKTTDITCTGATTGAVDPATGMAEVLLAAGQDAVCTYTNTRTASITVTKDVLPSSVTGPQGGFGFDTVGDGLADRFLNDGESFTLGNLLPGTYTIDELVPDGWSVSTSCTATVRTDPDRNSGTVSITLTAGQNVTCTYTNTRLGQITIRKDSSPDTAQDVTFTAAYNRGAPISFTLDDDGNTVFDPDLSLLPDEGTATGLPPGTYTITEISPNGWALDSVDCTGAVLSTIDVTDNTLTIVYDGAETLDCQFTNVQSAAPTLPDGGTLPSTGGGGLLQWWPIAELLIAAGIIGMLYANLRRPDQLPARIRKDR